MTTSELPSLSHVEDLLAQKGYDVTESDSGLLSIKDLETGIAFQAALEGNVLYLSVTLTTLPPQALTPSLMQTMLRADNGISTSAFKLIETPDRVLITLNNFCTLQNMGPEDQDDILSLTGYLMADLLEARELLEPALQSTTKA